MRYRWALLATLFVVGLVLGYIGLHRYAIDRGLQHSVPDLVHEDLSLLSFGYGTDGPLPWELQVARFLLPVVVVYGAFAGLYALFRDRFREARLPFVRGHVVIVGLGGASAVALAPDLRGVTPHALFPGGTGLGQQPVAA